MQSQQAVRRPHKAHAAPAGQFAVTLELVAHDFGNRQLGNGFEQGFLQAFGQRGTLDHAVVKQGFCLAVHGALELRHGRSVGTKSAQPLEQRRCGVAAGVQPHTDGHEFLRDGFVGRLGRYIGDVGAQPSRRSKSLDKGKAGFCSWLSAIRRVFGRYLFFKQAGLGQFFRQDLRKSGAKCLQGLGRQLFNKEFEQEVCGCYRHLAHAAFWFNTGMALCICATHSRGASGKPSRSRLSK